MIRLPLCLLCLLATTSPAVALEGLSLTGNPGAITCNLGTQATSYSPGVTFTERSVFTQTQGIVAGCVSLSDPSFQFGTFSIARVTMQSCLAAAGSSTRTIRWNNGKTSTFTATAIVNTKPDGTTIIVSTGTVTDGAFAGGTVQLTLVQPNTDVAACWSEEGLTAVSGVLTLSIVQP